MIGILRNKQKVELLKAIREEEKKEMERTRRIRNAKGFSEKKELEYFYGLERAKAKEKLDRIQK